MTSWLKTLRGQFVVVTAAAVILSSVAVITILEVARTNEIRRVRTDALLERAAASFELIADLAPEQREAAVRAMDTNFVHFWILSDPPLADHVMSEEETRMARAVRGAQENQSMGLVSVRLPLDATVRRRGGDRDGDDRDRGRRGGRNDGDGGRRNGIRGIPDLRVGAEDAIDIAQGLESDNWLLMRSGPPQITERAPDMLIAAALAALLTSAAAAWLGGRVSRPLSALAAAADEVARGRTAPHLDTHGPDDLRRASEAFNVMSERVARTLDSHRQLLSAVGHDLRTPLAAMRITAEFVKDEETRGRLTRNLDELQSLTEAVLSAARAGPGEEMHRVDLASLIQSVCDDLVDLEQPVAIEVEGPAPCLCRSNEIRRAVRNLIENAVRYGKNARVSLKTEPDWFTVVIEDDGPGIPEDKLEDVFQPFVRLEESRSSATGGFGLGLTLSRTIAREHGGEVTLENLPGGGLRASLRLPRAS